MAIKEHLVGIFLDQFNKDGYPEVYVVKKPKRVYDSDIIVYKFVFIKTKNVPDPLVAEKPFGVAIGPHYHSSNIPYMKEMDEVKL